MRMVSTPTRVMTICVQGEQTFVEFRGGMLPSWWRFVGRYRREGLVIDVFLGENEEELTKDRLHVILNAIAHHRYH
jgi:hypothetical protein